MFNSVRYSIEFARVGDYVPVYGIVAKPWDGKRIAFIDGARYYTAEFEPGHEIGISQSNPKEVI